MDSTDHRYIESCPVGCAAPLAATDIVLTQGAAAALPREPSSIRFLDAGFSC